MSSRICSKKEVSVQPAATLISTQHRSTIMAASTTTDSSDSSSSSINNNVNNNDVPHVSITPVTTTTHHHDDTAGTFESIQRNNSTFIQENSRITTTQQEEEEPSFTSFSPLTTHATTNRIPTRTNRISNIATTTTTRNSKNKKEEYLFLYECIKHNDIQIRTIKIKNQPTLPIQYLITLCTILGTNNNKNVTKIQLRNVIVPILQSPIQSEPPSVPKNQLPLHTTGDDNNLNNDNSMLQCRDDDDDVDNNNNENNNNKMKKDEEKMMMKMNKKKNKNGYDDDEISKINGYDDSCHLTPFECSRNREKQQQQQQQQQLMKESQEQSHNVQLQQQLRLKWYQSLAYCIQYNTSITEYDLSYNHLGDNGCQILSEALSFQFKSSLSSPLSSSSSNNTSTPKRATSPTTTLKEVQSETPTNTNKKENYDSQPYNHANEILNQYPTNNQEQQQIQRQPNKDHRNKNNNKDERDVVVVEEEEVASSSSFSLPRVGTGMYIIQGCVLTKLNLSGNYITDIGIEYLTKALFQRNEIISNHMNHKKGDCNSNSTSSSSSSSSSSTKIIMETGGGCEDEEVEEESNRPCCSYHPITTLLLGYNSFGTKGLQCLCTNLLSSSKNTITSLDLRGNHLGIEEFISSSSSSATTTTTTNTITNMGILAFLLQNESCTIRKLYINENDWKDEHILKLAKALETNQHLQYLDLRQTTISSSTSTNDDDAINMNANMDCGGSGNNDGKRKNVKNRKHYHQQQQEHVSIHENYHRYLDSPKHIITDIGIQAFVQCLRYHNHTFRVLKLNPNCDHCSTSTSNDDMSTRIRIRRNSNNNNDPWRSYDDDTTTNTETTDGWDNTNHDISSSSSTTTRETCHTLDNTSSVPLNNTNTGTSSSTNSTISSLVAHQNQNKKEFVIQQQHQQSQQISHRVKEELLEWLLVNSFGPVLAEKTKRILQSIPFHHQVHSSQRDVVARHASSSVLLLSSSSSSLVTPAPVVRSNWFPYLGKKCINKSGRNMNSRFFTLLSNSANVPTECSICYNNHYDKINHSSKRSDEHSICHETHEDNVKDNTNTGYDSNNKLQTIDCIDGCHETGGAILLPCQHDNLCYSCAQKIHKCHMCRQPVVLVIQRILQD